MEEGGVGVVELVLLFSVAEKPYVCVWHGCDYRATDASNLKAHTKTHACDQESKQPILSGETKWLIHPTF